MLSGQGATDAISSMGGRSSWTPATTFLHQSLPLNVSATQYPASQGRDMKRLIGKFGLTRTLLLFWSVLLITFVVIVVFTEMDQITPSVAAALATVVGILVTVIGFFQWLASREENGK
jgi:hypothetical protein